MPASTRPDVEAYRLMCAGQFAAALEFAERAVAVERTCVPAHGMLATILLELGRAAEAEQVVSRALEYPTGSAAAYDALAHVSMLLARHERSNRLYRRVADLAPGSARAWYNLASSERSFGRLAEAEAACDRAIALDSAHYPSYLLRSQLRVQTAQDNHVDQLQRLLRDRAAEDRARMFLGYALGKELDDLERFDEAFRWFAEGARTRRRHLAYDVAVDERKLKRICEVFAGATRAGRIDSSRYLFIVGLPRSGTTLLERILGGLSGVHSNGETDNFSRALLSASPAGPGDVFERAARADPDAVAARYAALADAGAARAEAGAAALADGGSAARCIVDKLPMNYLYLGAIRRALPDASLILVRRSPLDSCFAMYRTLFGEAYPFSYDFEDLARYYAAYEALIGHWRQTLGAGLREIIYEELVEEPRAVGAAIARQCGLAWSDRAIEIQANAAVSLTASAAQVRRPIYGTSSGRWRRYRTHLEPLVRALRRAGIALPADV